MDRTNTSRTDTRSTVETSKAIAELRRISGLTWAQLAELFEVSRRTVHFWASGKALTTANERRLLRMLDVVKEIDRGDARSTRAALFQATAGVTPLELLIAQEFDHARRLLGPGPGRRRVELTPLDATTNAARTPSPPAELFDARHDRVHRDVGHARAVRTVRSRIEV